MADEIINARIKVDGFFEIEVNGSKLETVKKLIMDLKTDHVMPFVTVQAPLPPPVPQYQQQQQMMQPQIISPQAIPQNAPPLGYPPNFR